MRATVPAPDDPYDWGCVTGTHVNEKNIHARTGLTIAAAIMNGAS